MGEYRLSRRNAVGQSEHCSQHIVERGYFPQASRRPFRHPGRTSAPLRSRADRRAFLSVSRRMISSLASVETLPITSNTSAWNCLTACISKSAWKISSCSCIERSSHAEARRRGETFDNSKNPVACFEGLESIFGPEIERVHYCFRSRSNDSSCEVRRRLKSECNPGFRQGYNPFAQGNGDGDSRAGYLLYVRTGNRIVLVILGAQWRCFGQKSDPNIQSGRIAQKSTIILLRTVARNIDFPVL